MQVWLTGLPCSGKTTIANALACEALPFVILDGDQLRSGLCADLGFDEKSRKENIRRVRALALLIESQGFIPVISIIAPYREDRRKARESAEKMIEIFVKCSLEVCKTRDVKGMYQKALSGEIKDFTGIDSPYEEPENPELIIDTEKMTLDECVERVSQIIMGAI